MTDDPIWTDEPRMGEADAPLGEDPSIPRLREEGGRLDE